MVTRWPLAVPGRVQASGGESAEKELGGGANGAEGEDAFGVADVIQCLAERPFAGFIPVARSIFGDVVRSRFVDVGEVVFRGFVAGG